MLTQLFRQEKLRLRGLEMSHQLGESDRVVSGVFARLRELNPED
jgi:hypothetical protein